MAIFELSQKAAAIYDEKSPEQKRMIIKYLFSPISSVDDEVNLSYTKFVSVIATKVRLTRKLIGEGK
jgi:hypothetical protein